MRNLFRLVSLFALCAALAAPAHAHRDRILPITADGAIPDIPPQFGPAKLTWEGLGTGTPVVKLRIGTHQNTLPLCAVRLILSKGVADVKVTGSWYHDEERGLPYYINVHFLDPARDPGRGDSSAVEFLFNLHDATLIAAKYFEAEPSGRGGQYSKIDVTADCRVTIGGRISTL